MRIAPEQISIKQLAGTTSDGNPILYVLTHGGLHALFAKSNGQTASLAAAPHKGIATFLAEKKYPGIKWDDKFLSNEPVQKSEEDNVP